MDCVRYNTRESHLNHHVIRLATLVVGVSNKQVSNEIDNCLTEGIPLKKAVQSEGFVQVNNITKEEIMSIVDNLEKGHSYL